jgi:hypothetical protein
MLGTRSAEPLNIVRWRLIFVGAQYGTYYYYYYYYLLNYLLTYLLTAVELSFGGSSPYTSYK